ncbi:pentatricopeptide repeat-containing protein At4g21190 [Selaginella moellendorffii]|uniref:pentatricopeptide repeat-containing protein At4g21190 n=1 Tax=Selaginella moellendorffii TaxID=88036 RepID=UPI000D1CA32F|nr:pentatricopeptide repeat-containing protein At4g21190 [Selaginella moellendorffii]|eukprot:XP_002990990.2 pentatricopeptide repeat-containing protein At4g21190 [Selaginella moellendorffii]
MQQAFPWTSCCDQLKCWVPPFQSVYGLRVHCFRRGKAFCSVECREDSVYSYRGFHKDRVTDGLQAGIISCRRVRSWICFAQGNKGDKNQGEQPKTWKKTAKRGSSLKAVNLIKCIANLSDCKEDIYGALDAWSAFEVDFPIEPVKKALRILRDQWQWKRVIQVSKWMLSKGHGKTMATYQLLIVALEKEDRIEEAEEVFHGVFRRYLDALPRSHFSLMMGIYNRAGMYEKLLDLFADMEELNVRPDQGLVEMVAEVYFKVGMPEKSEKVREKYPLRRYEYRYLKGRRIRVPTKRLYPELRLTKPSQEAESGGDGDDLSAQEQEQEQEEEEEEELQGGGLEDIEENEEVIVSSANDEDELELPDKMEEDGELLERVLLGEPVGEELLETKWQEQQILQAK